MFRTKNKSFIYNGLQIKTIEWERSAQLGNKVKLLKKMAKTLGWFKDNSELMTHPVGQKNKTFMIYTI